MQHHIPHLSSRRARYGRSLALLITLATAGCGPNAVQRDELAPRQPALFFENATPDQVRVYLVEGATEWLLGRVEPGRATYLRLPADVRAKRSSEVFLIAVPLGGRRTTGLSGSTDLIRSVAEPAENLITMRWTLSGRQLFSLPALPRGR